MTPLTSPAQHQRRQPHKARLSLNPDRGKGPSDGTWWPRTTNLEAELPALDLAVHKLTGSRIARIAYTYGQWPRTTPRKQRTPLGVTKIGWFTHSAHPENIGLSLADYTHLVLTVIQPTTDPRMANITLREHGMPPTGLHMADTVPVDRWENGGGGRLGTYLPKPNIGVEPMPPWTTR